MTSLATGGSVGPDASLPEPISRTVPSSSSIMSDLPDGYVVHHFSRFKLLRSCAETLLESFESKSGNQWLVVLGLSQYALRKLDEDHSCLQGIDYRFAREGNYGLIKIVPSFGHDSATNEITRVVDFALTGMGLGFVSPNSRKWKWVSTTTYKPTANKGKQADQGFLPPSRRPSAPGLPLPPAGQPSPLRRAYLNRYLS